MKEEYTPPGYPYSVLVTILPCTILTATVPDQQSWLEGRIEEPEEVFADQLYPGFSEWRGQSHLKFQDKDNGMWVQFPLRAAVVVLYQVRFPWDESTTHIDGAEPTELRIVEDPKFSLIRYVSEVHALRKGVKKITTWPLHEYSRT